jgi:hypothetical protein
MLPSLVELDVLAERLGQTLDPRTADGGRAQAALDDASALIRTTARYNWCTTDGDLLVVPDIITLITCAVAYRAYKNPTGASQSSTGDVSVSFSGSPGGAVYLTSAEHRAVRRAAGRMAASSIQLESDLLIYSDPLYAPTEGDPVPIGPLPWEDWG